MKEYTYTGKCPDCGKEKPTTYGLGVSLKTNVKLSCPLCKKEFNAEKYEENIYKNDKLDKTTEVKL